MTHIRAKVYQLNQDKWEDKGTGYADIDFFGVYKNNFFFFDKENMILNTAIPLGKYYKIKGNYLYRCNIRS